MNKYFLILLQWYIVLTN